MPTLRAVQEQTSLALTQVIELKDLLKIEVRWTPESQEYVATRIYVKERKYRGCLDTMERLVISRMFELQKTHIVGTSK